MLYVNDPEKCATFWSEQVGFIVKEAGEGHLHELNIPTFIATRSVK
ncbi:hypothetical protein [Lactobacillus delbrueckii]